MNISTKLVDTTPMSRQEYNDFRGWELPNDENGEDSGYLIEDTEGAPNTTTHKGYVSWLPASMITKSYHTSGHYTFSDALVLLKKGYKVGRAGWNGKGMFVFLVNGSTFTVNRAPLLGIYPEGTTVDYHAHVDMKTADDQVVPWLCSQTDMLANDWCIV